MKIKRNTKCIFVFLLFILSLTILSCTDETIIIQNGGGGDDPVRSEKIFTALPAQSLNNLYAGIVLPQNPGLAQNNWSGGHQDSYCSDSVGLTGPVTKQLKLIKQFNPYGFTPIMACNSNNQMIGVSFSYKKGEYRLIVFDKDLHILCQARTASAVPGSFGGGYFFLNNQENAVVVGDNQIKCYPTANVEVKDDVYELAPLWVTEDIVAMIPGSGTNSLYATMPIWDSDSPNLYWCLIAGRYDFDSGALDSTAYIAMVEVVPDPAQPDGCTTTLIDFIQLADQWNNNTFSVDEDGAYFVTNALTAPGVCDDGYLHAVAFDAQTQSIVQRWSYQYLNSGFYKVGMKNIGSGTTPTVMRDSAGNKIVTIGDNAYPQMNAVVVYRADGTLAAQVPVFPEMRSCDEASFIGVENSIIVENNFGHTVDVPDSQYVENEPGMALIMLDPDTPGYPADVVWEYDRMSFFAMSMLCRESGIIFAHTGDWFDDDSSVEGGMYYVSAIDSWDGRVIWRVPLGRGEKYCHEYGGIYFNHEKSLYMGTNAYLIAIQEHVN